MMSYRTVAVLVIAVTMAPGCSENSGPPPPYCAEHECTDYRAIGWIEKGKDAAKIRMIDPGSAEFRGVFFRMASESTPFTCGEINARNRLGGMAGFRRFLSAGSAETTFIDGDADDFGAAWEMYCRK